MYVAASITITLGAPTSAISTPAIAGPSSIVTRCELWRNTFAFPTSAASSPTSSGTIDRWAAKYGLLNAPIAKTSPSKSSKESEPLQ